MTRLFEAKPFIIAEVGSNWETLEHCLESIRVAKECGADAVKFQAFNYKALYGFEAEENPCSLPLNWLPHLKACADRHGIEFMCTAFSPDLVAAVDPFVEVHKVASSDAAWPQLLDAVAKTGKSVLLSTGAKSELEIALATCHFPDRVVPLYCVAAYPAGFVDFSVMVDICGGFSDHTIGITAAVEAARQCAIVIEKHFTAFPDLKTPDREHSVTPAEFKVMVDFIRGTRKSEIGPTPEESAMLLRHNRRLIATRDIAVGEKLTYGETYGAYRSLKDDSQGLSPFDWEDVEGRPARESVARGDPIRKETV